MNVHKYVTQHLKSNPVQKSLISRSIPLTHPMVQNNKNNENINNTNSKNFDDDNNEDDYFIADEDIFDDERDELEQLRIRFISISSVSSSAFAPSSSSESIEDNSNNDNNLLGQPTKSFGSNLSNHHLRTRSNTLERLEEEKRVRWYDEHFGTLISNSNISSKQSREITKTPSSLSSSTTTTTTTILPPESLSYPIKPSPSFELLTENSSAILLQKGNIN